MKNTNSTRRNPRYLSIPTLLTSLVFAHVVHMSITPLGLNMFACTGIYIASLALPIIIKRTFIYYENYDIDPFDPVGVSRLPTSRFPTMPNEDARN